MAVWDDYEIFGYESRFGLSLGSSFFVKNKSDLETSKKESVKNLIILGLFLNVICGALFFHYSFLGDKKITKILKLKLLMNMSNQMGVRIVPRYFDQKMRRILPNQNV